MKGGSWLFVGNIVCPCECEFLSVEWEPEHCGVVVEVHQDMFAWCDADFMWGHMC